MSKATIPKTYMVTWVDAHSEDAWGPVTSVSKKASTCMTVGFLVRKNKKTLSIAGSLDLKKPMDVACVMTIPVGCILKVKKIK